MIEVIITPKDDDVTQYDVPGNTSNSYIISSVVTIKVKEYESKDHSFPRKLFNDLTPLLTERNQRRHWLQYDFQS
jgi:hypothetical protein